MRGPSPVPRGAAGYHGDVYWATLQTNELPITVVTDTPGLFLHVLSPNQPGEEGSPSDSRHTVAEFPDRNLSFLHGIPAIGTKFHPAESTGPSGRPDRTQSHYKDIGKFDYHPTLRFYFGDLSAAHAR